MTKRGRITLSVAAFLALETFLIAFVDKPLSLCMHQLELDQPGLIAFFWAYTDFGKSFWYLWPSAIGIVLCATALRIKSLREEMRARLASVGEKLLFLFAAVAISGLVTDGIKPLLGRARPRELIQESFYGFRPFSFHAVWNSMPSGHSTTAFSLAFVLTALFPRWRPLWLLLAFLLALSRIMVNVHFLSDVIAGAVVGTLVAYGVEKALATHGMFHVIRRIFPIDRKNTMS
jgi:membrane-associated phospholipid phosphatase